ncbi:MAG: hypothetical protein OZSIB_0511 [Candidatus Ozemobacter sibiricus]|uniref:Uncharacterized protein n=1 Tax=Candidatus Ozemobacter sibiricus TaxID=2268124 RepID=A0A367ZLP9_9BACT|nr:MAG: hypothetical protein OZSIB_0511 [Candidatus Ozemobacter sibiricus]
MNIHSNGLWARSVLAMVVVSLVTVVACYGQNLQEVLKLRGLRNSSGTTQVNLPQSESGSPVSLIGTAPGALGLRRNNNGGATLAAEWRFDQEAYFDALAAGNYQKAYALIAKWEAIAKERFQDFKQATGYAGDQQAAMAFFAKCRSDVAWEEAGGMSSEIWKRDVDRYTRHLNSGSYGMARAIAQKWYRLASNNFEEWKKISGFVGTREEMEAFFRKIFADIDAQAGQVNVVGQGPGSSLGKNQTGVGPVGPSMPPSPPSNIGTGSQRVKVQDYYLEWKKDSEDFLDALAVGEFRQAKALVEKWLGYVKNDFEAVKKALNYQGSKEMFLSYLEKLLADVRFEESGGMTAEAWNRDVNRYSKHLDWGNFARARRIATKWRDLARKDFETWKKITGFQGSRADMEKWFEDIFRDIDARENQKKGGAGGAGAASTSEASSASTQPGTGQVNAPAGALAGQGSGTGSAANQNGSMSSDDGQAQSPSGSQVEGATVTPGEQGSSETPEDLLH